MEITIARNAGFCMGVKRAVSLVLDSVEKTDGKKYILGELIHNPQVLSLLKTKNVLTINKIPKEGEGTIFIRAHGVPPEIKSKIKESGFSCFDATCPHVIKVQKIIQEYSNKGFDIIILGDKKHPEVIGLIGYANKKGHIAKDLDDVKKLLFFNKAILVAQTTQNKNNFGSIKNYLERNKSNYKIFNTICNATEMRQKEIQEIAKTVDAIIIIGGKNSSNTKRLFEIAQEDGKKSFFVEDPSEVENLDFSGIKKIAIGAGASTPDWLIEKLYKKLKAI